MKYKRGDEELSLPFSTYLTDKGVRELSFKAPVVSTLTFVLTHEAGNGRFYVDLKTQYRWGVHGRAAMPWNEMWRGYQGR